MWGPFVRCVAGQDIAQSNDQRKLLFASKAFAAFSASILAAVMVLLLATLYPTSIFTQVHLQGSIALVIVAGGFVSLLLSTRTTVARVRDAQKLHSYMTSLQQVAQNRPFIEFLLAKVLIALAFHLSGGQVMYYFKYVLHAENSVQASGMLNLFGMGMIFAYIRPIRQATDRQSVRTLLRDVSVIFVLGHFILSLLPIQVIAKYISFIMPAYFSLLGASFMLLPSHLLASTLDYHKLINGGNEQAVYIMLDVNIIQMLDIIVGSVPSMILGAVGFRSNGGCTCGCGVACPAYHRWACRDDAGFACTSSMGVDNPPFSGEPSRTPPCLLQPDMVENGITAMFYYVPCACALAAAAALSQMSLTDDACVQLRVQLARRMAGKIVPRVILALAL